MKQHFFVAAALLVQGAAAGAHDIWVEPNWPLVPRGEDVELALKLGNHGQKHRDFKLATKLARSSAHLEVIGPRGERRSLHDRLIDNGFDAKEGYWSAPFTPRADGLYTVVSRLDGVASYAPTRNVKSAKAFFLSDENAPARYAFDKPNGAPLELVAMQPPVGPLQRDTRFRVRVLFKGRPLPNQIVSFVRRGVQFREDFDPRYEAKTDASGIADHPLREAGEVLLTSHRNSGKKGVRSGKAFEKTHCSATMRLHV